MRVSLQNYYGNSGYFFHSDDCHRWHNLWQHPAVHCSSRYKNKCPFPDPPQNKLPSGHRKRPGYCPQKPVKTNINGESMFCVYTYNIFKTNRTRAISESTNTFFLFIFSTNGPING